MSRRPTRTVLKELVDEKLSDSQIATALGVSSRTVLRWRNAEDLPSQWEPTLSPHGTPSSYLRGCRCEPCTKANTEYCRRYTGAKPRTEPAHGTLSRYQRGVCRCDECKAAGAAHWKARRARLKGNS